MSIKSEIKVKSISFRVGTDILNGGPGWQNVDEYQSMLLYAQALQDGLKAVYTHASIEWKIEPRLGISTVFDRVEVEPESDDDEGLTEYSVGGRCQRIANEVWQHYMWIVER
jgi:hypothetical protein